jgi:hypothetical protein
LTGFQRGYVLRWITRRRIRLGRVRIWFAAHAARVCANACRCLSPRQLLANVSPPLLIHAILAFFAFCNRRRPRGSTFTAGIWRIRGGLRLDELHRSGCRTKQSSRLMPQLGSRHLTILSSAHAGLAPLTVFRRQPLAPSGSICLCT